MTHFTDRLPPFLVAKAVTAALEEDLGLAGDITTAATVPPEEPARADIVARAPGRIAGLQCAEAAFRTFDSHLSFEVLAADGSEVANGDTVARVAGLARALLMGERVALNFLCHLSGIASTTSLYVQAVHGTKARICCTRKTTPGLRAFEKYAVRAGGGVNHRFGLFDAVLIKDNHVAAAGGLGPAIERARAHLGHMVKIEVEVDDLEQLEEALSYPVDVVMLDNMGPRDLARAVAMTGERVLTEASGGVTLDTVRAIAEAGVDLISVGALTHSPRTLDLGLDFR